MTVRTWPRSLPATSWRSHGGVTARDLRRSSIFCDKVSPWDQAGRSLFGGRGSFGNGAAMRVAPAALLASGNLEQVASLARQTAVITHAHELGVEGAVLQACAVALALRQAGGIDRGAFVAELREHVRTPVFRQKLQRINGLLTVTGGSDRAAVIDQLGNGIEAFESVPTAIYVFLNRPGSFKGAVTYAISLGGDTDTIACMVGALAGAHLGAEAIPKPWREQVEGSGRLEGLADSLLSLCAEP